MNQKKKFRQPKLSRRFSDNMTALTISVVAISPIIIILLSQKIGGWALLILWVFVQPIFIFVLHKIIRSYDELPECKPLSLGMELLLIFSSLIVLNVILVVALQIFNFTVPVEVIDGKNVLRADKAALRFTCTLVPIILGGLWQIKRLRVHPARVRSTVFRYAVVGVIIGIPLVCWQFLLLLTQNWELLSAKLILLAITTHLLAFLIIEGIAIELAALGPVVIGINATIILHALQTGGTFRLTGWADLVELVLGLHNPWIGWICAFFSVGLSLKNTCFLGEILSAAKD